MIEPTITVSPKMDPHLYVSMAMGEAEHDGWKVSFSTTGGLLLLTMTKPGERAVHEAIDLRPLYGDWVDIALARRNTEPPPTPAARMVTVRKRKVAG